MKREGQGLGGEISIPQQIHFNFIESIDNMTFLVSSMELISIEALWNLWKPDHDCRSDVESP